MLQTYVKVACRHYYVFLYLCGSMVEIGTGNLKIAIIQCVTSVLLIFCSAERHPFYDFALQFRFFEIHMEWHVHNT
jgi:hypothetical protein